MRNDIDINEPARHLDSLDIQLENSWEIKKRITEDRSFGKGTFAETYLVENTETNEKAFLKALDFSIALLADDPTKALIELSENYEFEKELLKLCRTEKLSKIIKILDQGKIEPLKDSIIPVPYFILEFSEGDLKNKMELNSELDAAWLLNILHNVTTGLWQLHKHQVAHTNLQPENVLAFSKELYKLSELGNAKRKGYKTPSNHNIDFENPASGTPEFLYGHVEDDWIYKNQATDAFLLGSLVFFLFTQTNFTTWLHFYLNDNHKWDKWGGTYEQVLPYLVEAYDKAIYTFVGYIAGSEKETKHLSELEVALRQLCHPDPKRRGHPKNISSIDSSLSLERYVSIFNRLAKEAKIELLNR